MRAKINRVSRIHMHGRRIQSAVRSVAAHTRARLAVDRAHRHCRVHHGLAHVIVLIKQLEVLLSIQRVEIELEGCYANTNQGHDNVFSESGPVPAVHDIPAALQVDYSSAVYIRKVVGTSIDSKFLCSYKILLNAYSKAQNECFITR